MREHNERLVEGLCFYTVGQLEQDPVLRPFSSPDRLGIDHHNGSPRSEEAYRARGPFRPARHTNIGSYVRAVDRSLSLCPLQP